MQQQANLTDSRFSNQSLRSPPFCFGTKTRYFDRKKANTTERNEPKIVCRLAISAENSILLGQEPQRFSAVKIGRFLKLLSVINLNYLLVYWTIHATTVNIKLENLFRTSSSNIPHLFLYS